MRVYIETTVPSYLVSWPSPHVVHAGHQISTHDWWDNHRQGYELYTSLVTHQEAAGGDPAAAQRRMLALQGIPLLAVTPECEAIANAILASGLIPAKADRDALHIAVATFHQMNILLTWKSDTSPTRMFVKICVFLSPPWGIFFLPFALQRNFFHRHEDNHVRR